MSEGRIGRVMAAIGARLALAGVAVHFLPGPGFPFVIVGLVLFITGLVMAAAHR